VLTPAEARSIEEHGLAEIGGVLVRPIEIRGLGGTAASEGLVLGQDGTMLGRLLGGAIDERLSFLTEELLASERDALTVGLSVDDESARAAGMVCGGRVELLLQRLTTVPAVLWQAISAGRPATVVTVCTGPAAGTTAVIDDLGAHGEERLVELGIGEILAHHAGLVGAGARKRTMASGGESLLLEVVQPTTHVAVIGTGELAHAVRAQAEMLGWVVTAAADLDGALDAVRGLGPNDAVVVLTHTADLDTHVLANALRGGVGFVGALGSRNTQAARAVRLRRDEHIPDEWIANIHGPLGLDIGAATPHETAVAIAAEIILTRSGHSGLPLRARTGRINPAE
jgi:xanthine dehydrogenase accessory factor